MFKKILASAAVASAMVAAAPAHAGLLSALNGYSGPLYFTMAGVDQGTIYNPSLNGTFTGAQLDNPANVAQSSAGAVGSEDSWGIFHITAIYTDAAKTNKLWEEGGSSYLVGTYGGLVDQSVTVIANMLQQAFSTGGSLSLWETTGLTNYLAAIAAGASGRDGSGNVAGVTGVGDLVLTANFGGTSNVAAPGSAYSTLFQFGSGLGNGGGYLNVTGGSAADYIKDGTVFDATGTPVDLSINSSNNPGNQTPAGWTVAFDGSVVSYSVPEPGTLVLAGMGLVGLAGMRRRKLPV